MEECLQSTKENHFQPRNLYQIKLSSNLRIKSNHFHICNSGKVSRKLPPQAKHKIFIKRKLPSFRIKVHLSKQNKETFAKLSNTKKC